MRACPGLFACWLLIPAICTGQTDGTRMEERTAAQLRATRQDSRSLPDSPGRVQAVAQPGDHSNDRLLWTLPNYLTVQSAQHVPPLTAREKFSIVARSSFDRVEYPYVAFLAGISQAMNSEPGYGQGAAGYGKRYGAAFADNTIENFMTGAILPSAFHQDPRYFQLGRGSFKQRAAYAVSRLFVTRSDRGYDQFNVSELLGSAITAGIGNAYRPAEDRTIGHTIGVWLSQLGWDALAITGKEFWPDIRRKLQKRRATHISQDSSEKYVNGRVAGPLQSAPAWAGHTQ